MMAHQLRNDRPGGRYVNAGDPPGGDWVLIVLMGLAVGSIVALTAFVLPDVNPFLIVWGP